MTSYVRARDGVRLAYDEAGDGQPVLLVHGLGLSRRRWQSQLAVLAAAGYRAVRFDLRGFGDSEMPSEPYDMATLVGDLSALADALELERFHLVGHSLGGMIALRYAVDHPERVRSLTIASTTSHNGRRASLFARAMARISVEGYERGIAHADVRAAMEAGLADAFPDGAPPLEQFRRQLARPNIAHAYAWGATAEFSVKDDLVRLSCPVLVLHGTADPLIPYLVGQVIHWLLPGSRWVPLEGAGHSVQVERAQEFNDALVAHLRAADDR